MKTSNTRSPGMLRPALAAALMALSWSAHAQQSATTTQEVQRGLPAVDVDTNSNQRARNNGVPGVDMDVRTGRNNNGVPGVDVDTRSNQRARNNGVPGVDVDTRASGAQAGDMTAQRMPRADRN